MYIIKNYECCRRVSFKIKVKIPILLTSRIHRKGSSVSIINLLDGKLGGNSTKT